jgi:glucans biosynthesis protein
LPLYGRLHGARGTAQDTSPQVFDYAWLKNRARILAGSPYVPPSLVLPRAIANLTWNQYQSIQFKPKDLLWADRGLAFRIGFFHLGLYYKEPVEMYEVLNGQAREIPYSPSLFDFHGSGVDPGDLPENLGFAGFRIFFHEDWSSDVTAFLGGSYFRAVGGSKQYGLSARGLAIDTGLSRPEEFPIFKAFWFERPKKGSFNLTLYALLDSPSIAGAYRFDIFPGAPQIMDVDAALYVRANIERLGVAPLTSMFLIGENDRRVSDDWRPAIHDSDGLAIWTGKGERIWRPLVNPSMMRVNSFLDHDPIGFGLLQRDRNFSHYQDDADFYELRPSLWVEPKKVSGRGWGEGAVQLMEIPVSTETSDNIVAYWRPTVRPPPGQELLLSYRLYWGQQEPFPPSLGHVVATFTGIGGVVGQKRTYFSWRFVVDFAGDLFAMLGAKDGVEPIITLSRGLVEIPSARPLKEIKGYRAIFDLRPTDESVEPIDMRLYLSLNGQALTETWFYQYTPPPPQERLKLIAQ